MAGRNRGERAKRRYVRVTRWRRASFFRALGETGNVAMACEAAGVGSRAIYRLKRVEPGFGERMAAAREEAAARLARSAAAPGAADGGIAIRRGIGGRLRAMAAGPRAWTERHDATFLRHLRETGNVAASARAAGFTPKSAYNRRKARPGFARDWAAALPEAEARLERALVAHLLRGLDPEAAALAEAGPPPDFDVWHAIWYLNRRERLARRRGRGGGAGGAA